MTNDDATLLSRQGIVRGERLPSGSTAFKLRYRDSVGRQRVLYIGLDASLAAELTAELVSRQANVRGRRALRRSIDAARRQMRLSLRSLRPILVEAGWHLHGSAIRRSRKSAAATTSAARDVLTDSPTLRGHEKSNE
jgi:hypothetical protein